jgi:GNAT superfamily N-acetyltransferase
MFAWTATPLEPPVEPLVVELLQWPSVDEYRRLYNGVGRDYDWTDRNRLPDEQLRQAIQHPDVEIHRLVVQGEVAGYSELDRREALDVELAYFGLFPQFIGRGLGKYFLAWTLQQAWSAKPRRVWVHTCDLDHPAALPLYQRAGFEIYRRELIHQVV